MANNRKHATNNDAHITVAPAVAAKATTVAPAAKPTANTLPDAIASIKVKANGTFTGKATSIFGALLAQATKPITMAELLAYGTANIVLPHSKKDKQWIIRSYVRDALLRFKYLDKVA